MDTPMRNEVSGEEVYQIWKRPKSPDYDIRLRYAYTLNCLSQLAEQYFSRLDDLRSVLKPQFDSGSYHLSCCF